MTLVPPGRPRYPYCRAVRRLSDQPRAVRGRRRPGDFQIARVVVGNGDVSTALGPNLVRHDGHAGRIRDYGGIAEGPEVLVGEIGDAVELQFGAVAAVAADRGPQAVGIDVAGVLHELHVHVGSGRW